MGKGKSDRNLSAIRQRSEQRKARMVGHRAASFEEAERWDLQFWQSRSPQERLSALVAIHRDVHAVGAGANTPRGTAAMMYNPPHPGEILRSDYIEPLELSVTNATRALGVTRKTLSAILNERAGIGPSMAHRLSKAFDTTPEFWINLQTQYDLWKARDTELRDVKRLVPA